MAGVTSGWGDRADLACQSTATCPLSPQRGLLPETPFTPGRENVPVCTGPAALQFISPCPGARTWYFPGQGSYPSFSEVAVLVSPTLSKLFFFPCSLFPFCNCDQCEAPVPLYVPCSPFGAFGPQIQESAVPLERPRMQGKMDLRRCGHPRALI